MSKVKIIFGILAIILLSVFLFFTFKYPFLLFLLLILIEILATDELYTMFGKRNLKGNKILTIILILLITSAIYFFDNIISKNEKYITLSGVIISVIIFLPPFLDFIRTKKIPDFSKFNLTLFSLLYISLYNYILLISLLTKNIMFLVLFLLIVYSCDIGAYFSGVLLGRKKIISIISPNKTWEGFLGGIVLSVIISLILTHIGNQREWWSIFTLDKKIFITFTQSISLGVILAIFAQIGDLYESAIKRYCNVKDSGKLIPEHGGVLDRTDSLLFAAPIFLYYLHYLLRL